MKSFIIFFLAFTSTLLTAQNTVTWLGGTPGKETKWNEAKNWNNHQVPDEYSNVIIKRLSSGHDAQPVIVENVEVASIEIQSGAQLTIFGSGNLLIDGEYIYTEGISIYGGKLVNGGIINFYNLANDLTNEFLNNIQNTGYVFVDDQLRKGKAEAKEADVQLVVGN